MSLAVEGQHVVLAHREKVDILDDYHLAVLLLEEGIGQHLLGVLLVTSGEHLHGFGHTHGSLLEPLALWVFAQKGKDIMIMGSQLVEPGPVFWFYCHCSCLLAISIGR